MTGFLLPQIAQDFCGESDSLDSMLIISVFQKVILVGGFAGSPSLKGYLEKRLKDYSARLDYPVELIGITPSKQSISL